MKNNRLILTRSAVVEAARCVVNSYRATGGYTLPLSINLRQLESAQLAYDAALHAANPATTHESAPVS